MAGVRFGSSLQRRVQLPRREVTAIADRDVVSWIGEKMEVDQIAKLSR